MKILFSSFVKFVTYLKATKNRPINNCDITCYDSRIKIITSFSYLKIYINQFRTTFTKYMMGNLQNHNLKYGRLRNCF